MGRVGLRRQNGPAPARLAGHCLRVPHGHQAEFSVCPSSYTSGSSLFLGIKCAQQKSGTCSVRMWDLKTGSLLLGTTMTRAGGSKGEGREGAMHFHTPSPRPEGEMSWATWPYPLAEVC